MTDTVHRRHRCSRRRGDGLAEQGAYIQGGRFLWSADSRHYVYVVTRGSAFAIVHDGVESPPYPRIGTFSVRFLDDGRLA